MKALLMSEPAANGSATSVAEVAAPEPGPGQVAIDVAYAGINFIDVMARRGDPGYASAWPYVPGLEVAGTVRAVGAGVTDKQVGQRVAAFTPGGGLAEVALASAEVTVSVPDGIPLETAASAPLVVSTAVLLLTERARIRLGETVLMHSASGGLGSVVSQLAATLGSGRRIGTVGRAGKIADGLAAGWDDVFARDDDLAEAVHKVAPGGVDVILDPTGTGLLDLDLSLAAPGGRVVLFGNAAGGTPCTAAAGGTPHRGQRGDHRVQHEPAHREQPACRCRGVDQRFRTDRQGQRPARHHRCRVARIRRAGPRPSRRRARTGQVRGAGRDLTRAGHRGPTRPSCRSSTICLANVAQSNDEPPEGW